METYEEKKKAVEQKPRYGNDRAITAMQKADSPLQLAMLLMGV